MPPTILFSQLPEGHAAVVLIDAVGAEDVVEAHVRLASVPKTTQIEARQAVVHRAQRTLVPKGTLSTSDLARMGADVANALVGGHDPRSFAPFPVDEDVLQYRVATLRPALIVGRDFLDQIGDSTGIPAAREIREALIANQRPLRYQDFKLDVVGVESNLVSMLQYTGGLGVRAKLQLKQAKPDGALPPGVGLHVLVSARVYEGVLVTGGLPDTPLADGPSVPAIARLNEPTVVDLMLPAVSPPGAQGYLVVAKVISNDPLYRGPFEPSHCYAHILKWS